MLEKKKPVHYVDNKKFYEEIVKHQQKCKDAKEAGKEEPRISNYLGECIYKMAEKISYMPKFVNYSFREEMVSDAIENCIVYFHDFNPEKYTNPFAYFTQVIYYAFLRRISKEEKDRYIKYKYFQETIIHTGDTERLTDVDGNNLVPAQMYDNLNTFMSRFEAKEEEKKRKRKEMKSLQRFIVEEVVENDPEEFEPTGTSGEPDIKTA